MDFKFITYRVEQRVCRIRLNRADKKNALNAEFVSELKTAFDAAAADERAKVIILEADGDVFSAGADLDYLQSLQSNSFEENVADSKHLMELFSQIYQHPKVVIAQIEGHAIAGGCGLAAVCDISFATPNAKFGYSEVRIGFIPAIVMVFLLRKLGESRAKELLLGGMLIDASTAERYGLINFIIEPAEMVEHVSDFARKLCENNSSESMKRTKQLIANVQSVDLNTALELAVKMNAETRSTDDCKKGIASFLDKTNIQW